MRAGLETLNRRRRPHQGNGARGKLYGAGMKVTCDDHSGENPVYAGRGQVGEGPDWIEPMKDKIRPTPFADAKAYADKNALRPARTEACGGR